MRRMEILKPRLEVEKEKTRSYYRRDDTTYDHNNWLSALGSFITNGLLQTGLSFINNISDTFAPLISGGGAGKTTLKQVGRTWLALGTDFAGGLTEIFGLSLGASSVEGAQWNEEKFNDDISTFRVIGRTEDGITSDVASAWRSSDAGWFTNTLQAWSRMSGSPVPWLKANAQATPIRPLALFTYGIRANTKAITVATWQRVGDMVLKGMEYFASNPADARDPTFRLSSDGIGLRGTEKAAWDVFSAQMMEGYNLDITAMTREAMARGAGPANRRMLLSRLDRAMLAGFVSKHLTLDASIDSMTTRAWNNSVLRFLLPLWSWSLRRALQVANVPFDSESRFRIAALGRGVVGLGLLATSGFAMALLADEYAERLLGRKRNLRSLKSLPGALENEEFGEVFLTVTENLNRAGTFGMWSEILNSGINVYAGGGDNRVISLDNRVVMMSSFLGIQRAFSALATTRDLDYTSVVRPFLVSLGGNSALHFTQLANRALDLDNVETRFVERTSVQNELRVAGR